MPTARRAPIDLATHAHGISAIGIGECVARETPTSEAGGEGKGTTGLGRCAPRRPGTIEVGATTA